MLDVLTALAIIVFKCQKDFFFISKLVPKAFIVIRKPHLIFEI